MDNSSNPENIQFDKTLVDKYNLRGPRYTSYPTSMQFRSDYTAKDYEAALTSIKNKTFEPLSLYIHLPFCQDICYYCACNKVVTQNRQEADTYLDYLEKEMALLHKHISHQRRVSQLHLGGGSPTFLNAGQMTRLIHTISRYFKLTDNESREYSIEIDPRTVSKDNLALLKGLGFNRLSIGVQDFSVEVQKAVNRISSFDTVEEIMNASRDYGFNSINIDLIYGLPKQTLQSLIETTQKVIRLSPDRITFYNYAHLPEHFSAQRAIDRLTLPTAEQKLEMLNIISSTLTKAGYLPIGMDHFVKSSDELAVAQKGGKLWRNFQGYSTCTATDIIGLGVSSISSGATYFSQNNKSLEEYYQSINNGQLPVNKGLQCSNDDIKRRAVIMALIDNLTFDINEWEKQFSESFKDYFDKELQQLKAMQEDGLLNITKTNIEVLPKGRTMIRNICVIFDLYHNPNSQNFSKVI